MKKYGKMLMVGVLTLIAGVITANAKEMSVSELLKEVEKQNANTQDVYIIGEYAYTSKHIITSQDIMLASLSINAETKGKTNKDDSYEEMVMQHLSRTMDANGQYSQWSIVKPKIGKENKKLSDLNQKIDVDFIDYNYIKEESKATITFDVDSKDKYKETLKEYLKFETKDAYGESKLAYDGKKVSGLLLKNNKITLSKEDKDKYKNPVYFLAYVLEIPNASEKTKIKVDGINGEGTIEWKDFDVTEGNNSGVVVLVPINKDAWEKNKKIKLTINTDEEIYEDATYEIDLSELRFQGDSEVEINDNTANISDNDKDTLAEWGYEIPTGDNKKYSLSKSKEENETNKYVLEGEILEQHTNENVFATDGEDGYYFLFNLLKPETLEEIPENTKITIKGKQTLDFGKKDFENNVFTNLFKLNDQCKTNDNSCQFEVIVDWDGDGEEYLLTTITIDYTNLKFIKNSQFKIESIDNKGEETLKNAFGWKKENDFNTEFTQNGTQVNVSGFLPILEEFDSEKHPFGEEDETGYYLPFAIKTSKTKENDKTIVKIINGDEEKTIVGKNFDDANILYVLRHLDKNAEDKTFTIIVDMDGDGKEYEPYTLTIDWSKLVLQEKTIANISVDKNDVAQSDKEVLKSWNYQFPDDIELSKENTHNKGNLKYDEQTGNLSGTIKEQKLTGGFSKEELDSYFYTFTIKPEVVTNDIKVSVEVGDEKNEYNIDNFDSEKKSLTILQHIPLKKSEPKKIKITIDTDGNNKNFKESKEYTIDYSQVDFVELHSVTFNGYEDLNKDIYDGEKLDKPTDPVKEKHNVDINQYNTFAHWSEIRDDNPEEYNFTGNKSTNPVTEDLELSAIWDIDVEQYMTDAISEINKKDSIKDKFKLEQDENDKTNLTLDILDRTTKIENINDTAIASTIAHALISGEIESINLELDDKTLSLKPEEVKKNLNTQEYNEQNVKTEVAKEIKEFLKEKIFDNDENKTLDDLYNKIKEEKNGMELGIFPEKTIAQIKGKSEQAGITYNINALEELEISFDAGALNDPDSQFVKTGEALDKLPEPEISEKEKEYRTFEGWYSDKDTKVERLDDVKEDTELKAHYKLNVDKFIEEVVNDLNSTDTTYSDNFGNKFKVDKDEKNINLNLNSPKVPLTELAETSIPGTIAYILQRGEIKDVTLTVGNDNSDTFNSSYIASSGEYNSESERDNDLLGASGVKLKQEIIKGAKVLFDKELSNHEATATLDQLEYSNKSFTLKIGETDDTITLVKENNEKLADTDKTYTFNFNANFAVVNENNEENLGAKKIEEVLNKNEYKTIYVDSDITLNDTLNVSADQVTIRSLNNANGEDLKDKTIHTIKETDNNKEYVIDIKSGTINLSDLKLAGAKKAELKVEEGAIVSIDNLDVSDIKKAENSESNEPNVGILVTGTLKATNLINKTETYNTPTIAIFKDSDNSETNAKVEISNMTKKDVYNYVKRNGKNYDDYGNLKYGSFYYLDDNHSKLYFMGLIDPYKTSNSPYDYIKVYYYDELFDINSIGYKVGDESDDHKNTFKQLRVKNSSVPLKGNEKVQDIFVANDTTVVYAEYDKKN